MTVFQITRPNVKVHFEQESSVFSFYMKQEQKVVVKIPNSRCSNIYRDYSIGKVEKEVTTLD